MASALRILLAMAGLAMAGHAAAQPTFYEREDFKGRAFTAEGAVENFERQGGFNRRAASVVVEGNRWERWEVCDDRGFRGRCVVLRPGRYASLSAMGLTDRVASVRAVDRNARDGDRGDPPLPVPPPQARPGPPASQIDLYADEGFRGRSFSTDRPVADFGQTGFRDRASSAVVTGERWEVCQGPGFRGACIVLTPGQYPSLAAMGFNDRISSVRALGRGGADERNLPLPVAQALPSAASRVVLYEGEGFQGRTVTLDDTVADFRSIGFNDRASSVVVSGDRWEFCADMRFGGECVVLRPGQYPSLASMGINDRVSSARAVGRGVEVDERRYAPLPAVSRDYGRRNEERVYEVEIASVRAVVEDSGRRCWVEPQQAVQERSGGPNVPGALLGAVIGGILGHQVGGGTGKDVATGVGVIAGAVIGNNAGRGDAAQQVVTTQGVERCTSNPGQARAAYWDVSYNFRGQEHRVQLNKAPGRTLTVNEQGEPRV
jgi:uncharacterized protein YcfJ